MTQSIAVSLVLLLVWVAPADPTRFVPLFDGESLAGWTSVASKAGNWRVEEGMLVTPGNGKGWLSTNRMFEDFELILEYRIGRSGNSGVLIRAPRRGDPSFDGMEIQILDDDAPAYRKLKPEQYTGSVYGVIPARRGQTRPAGEWNRMKIQVVGQRVMVDLNGVTIVDGNVTDHPEVLPRHSGVLRTSGYVGLQSHESPVQFRKIAIREIRRASSEAEARPTGSVEKSSGD